MELIPGLPVEEKVISINLWVTSACNFLCSYCYEGDKKSDVFLDEKSADKIVDFIHKQCLEKGVKTLGLCFHGGEPMLNAHVIKYVVDLIRSANIIEKLFTAVTTNCYFYDETITDYISEFTVSIDGTRKAHDINRVDKGGNPTYDRCIVNAKKYLEKDPSVRLRMVVTPNNVKYLFEGVKELIEIGFKLIVPGLDHYSDLWTDALMETYYEQMVKIREYLRENMLIDVKVAGLNVKITEKEACRVGCDGYQIDADGKIYSCVFVVREPYYCIGDIENGFDEEKIAELNRIGEKKVEECKGCGNYRYCVTNRCLLLNKQLTGDYYTPSPVICAEENVKLRLKGIL